MKVTMLRNPAAKLGCKLTEGQTGEVPTDIGRELVKAGLAVCLDQAPVAIKAVPPAPAIAEPRAVEPVIGDVFAANVKSEVKPKTAKAETKPSK